MVPTSKIASSNGSFQTIDDCIGIYCTTKVKENVLAGAAVGSKGRLYSIEIVLWPALRALKVQTSLPPAPGMGIAGGWYLWFVCCITVLSPMLAFSFQL